jgi:hypothetical protein
VSANGYTLLNVVHASSDDSRWASARISLIGKRRLSRPALVHEMPEGSEKLDSEWTRHRRITSRALNYSNSDLPKRMNPMLQYRTIAREFGITRQRVARVAAELGMNGRERQHQRTLLTFASLSENLSEQIWRSCHPVRPHR